MKEELLHIKKELSKKLKKERFEHTVGVMYTICFASYALRGKHRKGNDCRTAS